MAFLALPPPKAEPFLFSHLHCHNKNPIKPNSPTVIQKHKDSVPYAPNIRKNEKQCLRYGAISRKVVNIKMAFSIVRAASSIPVKPKNEKDSSFDRISQSDVAVKRRRNVYCGRKWNYMDVIKVGVVLTMHILCIFAPFTFNWDAFWVGVGLYVITFLLGISLSFHRNLSHRSFKLPKWLEYFFASCGVQALQGHPIGWVSTHRYHHQFCDTENDPHSPIQGFWFSHIGWNFDTNAIVKKCGKPNNVGDLEKQPFYKFLQRTYFIHPIALGGLLYAVGGFPYIVWGMGVRVAWTYHITWFVNSVSHTWGKKMWKTSDLSRNNWWLALLTFGEGWHNNHHAFEYSAKHGLEWWQIDTSWCVIRFLEAIGWQLKSSCPPLPKSKGWLLSSKV